MFGTGCLTYHPTESAFTMPKVVLVSQLPPPTHGSTMMTALLFDQLVQSGNDVSVVDRRFSSSVSEVGRVSLRKIFASVGLHRRYSKAISESPDTVIYFLTNRLGSFLVDCMVILLRSRTDRPRQNIAYVHTVGFQALARRSRILKFLVGRVLDTFDRVVVLGPSLASDVLDWVERDKIVVIQNPTHNTVEVGPGERRRGHDNEGLSLRLLYVSNLIEEKGVLDFVELARRFGSGFSYRIAGHQGTTDMMSRLEQELGSMTATDIEYVGPVTEEQRSELFAWADLLVFPSRYRYEAQPLVIIESFAAGLPVAAYDTGGIGDLVRDGENGMLMTTHDVHELTERIRRVTPSELAAYALGARETFTKHHTIDAYMSKWRALLSGAEMLAGGDD